MAEHWTVNSDTSETAYFAHIRAQRKEHGYLTISAARIGKDRSLDANALLHVWAREYTAHLLGKHTKKVTKGELAGFKRTAKIRYTQAHPNDFTVHTVECPFTRQEKRDYSSSADWKVSELFAFMEWLQLTAANDGLILESTGQYGKLQRKANN